jgi:hypothetical protein
MGETINMGFEQYRDHLVMTGWRIVAATENVLRAERGRDLNHILHIILSILSGGLWVVVWVALSISGGKNQITVRRGEADNQVIILRKKRAAGVIVLVLAASVALCAVATLLAVFSPIMGG